MPVGEEVPILIPVSIILVIFILALFTLYINFSNQTEIVEMSQKSLTIAEYVIKNGGCLEDLQISSNYKIYIRIGDEIWGDIEGSNTVVVNSMPFLMNGNPSKVVVSVGK